MWRMTLSTFLPVARLQFRVLHTIIIKIAFLGSDLDCEISIYLLLSEQHLEKLGKRHS